MEDAWQILAGLIGGGAFVGLGGWLLKLLDKRAALADKSRQAGRAERKDAIDELSALVDDLRRDVDRAGEKADRAVEAERRCDKRLTRAIEYIAYIGYEARRQGWNLRPWAEDGTDDHPALERRGPGDPDYKGPERRE